MTNTLWKELVRGGGINKPPYRALYGDDILPLMCWAWEALMIGTITIFPLACMELGRSGLLGQVRRYVTQHGRSTSRVAYKLAHLGFLMMHGGTNVGSGIQKCIGG